MLALKNNLFQISPNYCMYENCSILVSHVASHSSIQDSIQLSYSLVSTALILKWFHLFGKELEMDFDGFDVEI